MKKSIYLPRNVYKRIKMHEFINKIDVEKLRDNPVCPKCERVALRDIGYSKEKIATCPHCGYKGVMSVTLKEYAEKQMYR